MRQTDRLFNVVLSGSELYEKTRAFFTKMLKIARFDTKFFISRKTFFIFVITEEKSSHLMRIVLQMALRHMTPQLRDEYTGRLFQQKPIPIYSVHTLSLFKKSHHIHGGTFLCAALACTTMAPCYIDSVMGD